MTILEKRIIKQIDIPNVNKNIRIRFYTIPGGKKTESEVEST
jgi:hypothetical protein